MYQRVWQHKHRLIDGFTRDHDCTNLVYIAQFEHMDDAIAWEKALKGKSRAKKIALIEARNPRWNDLAWDWYVDGD
jgi:putative endonuclease